MSWIKTIKYSQAEGKLRKIYDKVKGPGNNVDNVLMVHSLRPHTLEGHMALYKNVIHNSNNTLPKWYLEALGVYVSHLNKCKYCFDHHYVGFKRLLDDDTRSEQYRVAVLDDNLETFFDGHYLLGAKYAQQLTLAHDTITQHKIIELRTAGFDDGEILELNQLVSYFNYVNRTVVGLGVDTKGDMLGLSPNDSDDPNNWSHS